MNTVPQNIRKAKRPLWKWILLLVSGFVLTFGLYAFAPMLVGLSQSLIINSMVCVAVGIAMLGVYTCWSRVTEKHWTADLGLRAAPKSILTGFGTGLAMFCAIIGVLALSKCYRVVDMQACYGMLAYQLCFFFMVSCGEEVVFRGILFRMIDERFNMWTALIVSGLFFGFIHILNPGATVWSSVAIALEAGLLLGAAYKAAGNLWLPIGIHWSWNFTQGNIFGCNVSGGGSSASLLIPEISGPELITGGPFGPEASLVTVVVCLVVTVGLISLRRK